MWYFVGALLRKNGRVEFYSDFIYTDYYFIANHECVDIESGGYNFYFKFVDKKNNNEKIENHIDLKYKYYRAR